jgi:hypothetical protein
MKEDVLEQIVDDYLQFQGYFTRHNVRFGPPPVQGTPSQSHSDLDVIGFHPRARSGERRVVVVSCKSWQKGFNATEELTALRKDGMSHGGKARWGFRDLWFPDWSNALHQMVLDLTGESTFTYWIAVTRLRGISTALDWEKEPTINANLRGCSFGFLTLEEMWDLMLDKLTTVPAGSEIGRLAQLLKAAGLAAPPLVATMPGSDAELAEELEGS